MSMGPSLLNGHQLYSLLSKSNSLWGELEEKMVTKEPLMSEL